MPTDVPLTVRTPSPLGEYLRSRRQALAPEDVGITAAAGRKPVGLTRLEVAELARISVEYYSFIERGRDLRPSRAVLDAMAAALRLDADERAHLHALAVGASARVSLQREELTEELEELLDSLDPNPAYVVGARWDILGSNSAAQRLFSDWERKGSSHERNLLWYYCCDPAARSLFVDWEQEAADQLALFREAYARHPDDAEAFQRLLDDIFATNPHAQRWWETHDRDPRRGRTKRIRLDDDSIVQLHQLVLALADDPDIAVIAYFAHADGDIDGLDFDA
ncbi:MAG: helix-turn-helix transcriptional regulator [Micrococcales bacterium]|nr:helix-turn-helix transcriptional regulator [Micrococcales bacterium]